MLAVAATALILVLIATYSSEWRASILQATTGRRLDAFPSLGFSAWKDSHPVPDPAPKAFVGAELAEEAAVKSLRVAFEARSVPKGEEFSEAKDDSKDEDKTEMHLEEAELRIEQWRLHSAEKYLDKAVERAEGWLNDLKEDDKPRAQQMRAGRKLVQVLLRLGSFLQARGRSQEALKPLKRAQKLSIWLAPPSASAHGSHENQPAPADLGLRARTESAQAKNLCTLGGKKGELFQKAKKLFESALQTTAEAQAAAGKDGKSAFADLAVEVSTDLAQCLHQEGDLDDARKAVQQALDNSKMASGNPNDPDHVQIMQHLERVEGGVVHDEGLFDEASRLYGDYLKSASSRGTAATSVAAEPGTMDALADPDAVVESFGVMQDLALALASQDRIQQALDTLRDVDHLQAGAIQELRAKNKKRFIGPGGGMDLALWASRARTLVVRAELLLTQSDAARKKPPRLAETVAKRAVSMLRKAGNKRDLEDALNSLGNAELALGDGKQAEEAYSEALKITLQQRGEDTPFAAAIYHNLGVVEEARKNKEKALELFKKALDIQMRTIGFKNPDTAASFGAVADCLEKIGRHDEATEYVHKAAESTRALYPKDHRRTEDAEARVERHTAAQKLGKDTKATLVEATNIKPEVTFSVELMNDM
jgi:tetratricopeptide (TPR) repeat protein